MFDEKIGSKTRNDQIDDMWLEDNENHPYPQPNNETSNTTQEKFIKIFKND